MKKLLILAANFPQSMVIKRAKELGYHTIAISNDPDSVGFQEADEYGMVDITDAEACLAFARAHQIDGVMSPATDTGVLAAAYVAQELGLPGINLPAAKLIKNKHAVRKLFAEHQIDDVAQFYQIKSLTDAEAVADQLVYPVMVKPTDGAGSKATKRVDRSDDLAQACQEAMDASLVKQALIEDFIIGKEYGVESFVYQGEVYVLGILNKEMTTPPAYAELGHMMPSGLAIEDKVKEVVTNAIKVLGVDFGSVNMDVLVTDDNQVCIIDIGARMGGNLIGSHIINHATEYDYLANAIKAAVNDEITLPQPEGKNAVVTQILALTPGKIVAIPDIDEIASKYRVKIFFTKEVGEVIDVYRINRDGCGFVLSVGDDLADVAARAKAAKAEINQQIVRAQTSELVFTKAE